LCDNECEQRLLMGQSPPTLSRHQIQSKAIKGIEGKDYSDEIMPTDRTYQVIGKKIRHKIKSGRN